MQPAYRPGIIPRMALTSRMGSRSRGQLMNDLMGECPSLLDDLVFYPMWMGSQYVDMISGSLLVNPIGVIPSGCSPDQVPCALFSGSQYMDAGIVPAYRDMSVLMWHSPVDPSTVSWLFSDYQNVQNKRRWALSIGVENPKKAAFVWSVTGGSPAIVLPSIDDVSTGWHLFGGRLSLTTSTCFYDSLQRNASGGQMYNTVGPSIRVGGIENVYANGLIGSSGVWLRFISDREHLAFYNGGQGLRYPFRR